MDPFIKRYIQVLAIVSLGLLTYWLSNLDFRAGELNDLLRKNEEIASYPYPFEVIQVENGIATMSSPRSAKVAATTSIKALFPELKDKDVLSPAMEEAQRELAYVQSSAANIVLAQEDIKKIVWKLDTRWLDTHGIQY